MDRVHGGNERVPEDECPATHWTKRQLQKVIINEDDRYKDMYKTIPIKKWIYQLTRSQVVKKEKWIWDNRKNDFYEFAVGLFLNTMDEIITHLRDEVSREHFPLPMIWDDVIDEYKDLFEIMDLQINGVFQFMDKSPVTILFKFTDKWDLLQNIILKEARNPQNPRLFEFRSFMFLFEDKDKVRMYSRSKTFLRALTFLLRLFAMIQVNLIPKNPTQLKYVSRGMLVVRYFNLYFNFIYQWPYVWRNTKRKKFTKSFLPPVINMHTSGFKSEWELRRKIMEMYKDVRHHKEFKNSIKNFITIYGTSSSLINQDMWRNKNKVIPSFIYQVVGKTRPPMINEILKRSDPILHTKVKFVNIGDWVESIIYKTIYPRAIPPHQQQQEEEEEEEGSEYSDREDDENEQNQSQFEDGEDEEEGEYDEEGEGECEEEGEEDDDGRIDIVVQVSYTSNIPPELRNIHCLLIIGITKFWFSKKANVKDWTSQHVLFNPDSTINFSRKGLLSKYPRVENASIANWCINKSHQLRLGTFLQVYAQYRNILFKQFKGRMPLNEQYNKFTVVLHFLNYIPPMDEMTGTFDDTIVSSDEEDEDDEQQSQVHQTTSSLHPQHDETVTPTSNPTRFQELFNNRMT